jgi:hypothetical protein
LGKIFPIQFSEFGLFGVIAAYYHCDQDVDISSSNPAPMTKKFSETMILVIGSGHARAYFNKRAAVVAIPPTSAYIS